jgi:outer membrane protein, heavy metal efflux system
MNNLLSMRYLLLIAALICCVDLSLNAQSDISLKMAIQLTLKNNPYYQAEKLNSDLAKAEIITAGMKQNPAASLSYIQIPVPKYFAENTSLFNPQNREESVELSKSFQVKGQRKLKIEKAEKDYGTAQSSLREFERNLVLGTAEKWLDVWYSMNKMNIVKAAKVNSDSLLKINQIRLKNQVITNTEFLRTQIVDDQYSLLLKSAEQEQIREIQNLKLLTGIDSPVSVSEYDSVFVVILPSVADSLINYALKNRTDIVVTKNSIDAARTDIRLQKANSYPQPEIGINYNVQEHTHYVGSFIAVPIPLFNRNQGEIAKSRILLNQTENVLYATSQKVKTEVENSWNEYSTNRTIYEKYRDIYRKSEKVLEVVRMAYLKGGTTILDYLEAERNWFELQNQYFEAFYNCQKSYLELLFVSNLIQNI